MKISNLQNKKAASRIGTLMIGVFLLMSVLGCSMLERVTKNNSSACRYLEDEGIKPDSGQRQCLVYGKLEESGKITMMPPENGRFPPNVDVRVTYQVSPYNIEITIADKTKNPEVEKRFLALAEKISQQALDAPIPPEIVRMFKEGEKKAVYLGKYYFKEWSTNGKKINGNHTKAEISQKDEGNHIRMNFTIGILAKSPFAPK